MFQWCRLCTGHGHSPCFTKNKPFKGQIKTISKAQILSKIICRWQEATLRVATKQSSPLTGAFLLLKINCK